ncbi:glycosyltransferase [Piscinibacter terrae]|uniref:glycosyltransferase n=1 Tax=Piscinibacter terrae TaxID=2496871 RepID=UPI001386C1E3|nr:glycosyltransferase [Albitalea terrae]
MSSRIAIVDPGSFILPYDFRLVRSLSRQGQAVDFYGSRTRYNGEFLEAMKALPGVQVFAAGISRTVAPRWRGALAYLGLLFQLLMKSRRYDSIHLQFSGFWPAEWLVFGLLQGRFVYTVHNAVPHGFTGAQHAPTLRLARLARSLVFVSEATRDDFMRRYGEGFRAKSEVRPHGLLPVTPDSPVVPYAASRRFEALVFWSRVQPYKGVELFEELARSPAIQARGLALEVFGAWDDSLLPLARELQFLGVKVMDGYLPDAELLALLDREVVFVLPYRAASQSGAMYALLNHGRVFICSDVGDLGAFMRRYGLEGLLLQDRSAESVERCLQYLEANRDTVTAAFARAQADNA